VLADPRSPVSREKSLMANAHFPCRSPHRRAHLGKPYIQTTWAKEIGKDGRPIVLPDSEPSEQGTRVCPDQVGGTNGNVPSMDAARGLFFVTVREICGVYYSWKLDFTPAQNFRAGQVRRDPDHDPDTYTALRAIDAATGARRWEFKYPSSTWAGTMSTASGLVFAGNDQATSWRSTRGRERTSGGSKPAARSTRPPRTARWTPVSYSCPPALISSPSRFHRQAAE
jgi:hypothetical protein